MAKTSLLDRIHCSLVPSVFDHETRKFCPENQFATLLTNDDIKRKLGEANSDTQSELIEWVYKNAKRIFAIMTHSRTFGHDALRSLQRLREVGLTDIHLPITEEGISAKGLKFPLEIWEGKEKGEDLQALDDFYQKQWAFLPPVFSQEYFHYELQPSAIFPFIGKTEGRKDFKKTAFSEVRRYTIHEAHQHAGTDVAIKKIMSTHGSEDDGSTKEWETEARALGDIRGLNHKNIVECLAAIRRGKEMYFMFPWANGGSLLDFWKQTKAQGPSEDLIKASVKQLYGLVEVLYRLHNFKPTRTSSDSEKLVHPTNGVEIQINEKTHHEVDDDASHSIRHGDLKPENILRFLDRDDDGDTSTDVGTLKMADMGLAKHHVNLTRDRSALTNTRHGTATYEPPETGNESSGGRSRLYDIWSMGCIIFEFLLWLLYGYDAIDGLYQAINPTGRKEIQYFESGDKGARVHRVVKIWIEYIRTKDPECKQASAIHDLLELVATKLLVVDLPPRRASEKNEKFVEGPPLQPDRPYRATAEVLQVSLEQIKEKLGNEGYAFTGTPREGFKFPGINPGQRFSNGDERGLLSTRA